MKQGRSIVKQAVAERLNSNSQVRRMGVEVEVDNSGAVTLKGAAHGYWSRELAQDLVRAVPGVTSVKNELSITAPPPRLNRLRSSLKERR